MLLRKGMGVDVKKRILLLVSMIIAIVLVVNVIGSIFFYELAIKRGPKDFLQGNEDLEVSAEAMDEFLDGDWIEWTNDQPFETLHMTSFDDLDLQGSYLPAEQETNKTVVFAHGYLGHGFDMGLFGEFYYEDLGFNLFSPDLRGHGKSGGDYYGFGWHDRLDLIDWIDVLIEDNPNVDIVLHGLSMGAATVLMASGEQLPDNVTAIVADSPYTSVYDLFAYQMKRMYHLPDKPVLPSTSLVTKMRAGYSLQEASALEQVKNATVPILYIHGEGDTFVPTDMTYELADVTNTPHEVITFPEANHGEAIVLHRDDYIKEITRFIERYMY